MPKRTGYTLIEILTATVLSLMLLGAVIGVYASVSNGMNDVRSAMEKSAEVQSARITLQKDLSGVTVSVVPIRDLGEDEGFLECLEGPAGPGERRGSLLPLFQRLAPNDPQYAIAVNSDNNEIDLSVCDNDDILMFTTQSAGKPFTGRALYKRAPFPGETATGSDNIGSFVLERTIQSELAEVAWFVRGRTLYRRVLLILPDFDADLRTPRMETQLSANYPHPEVTNSPGAGFYAHYDLSVRNTLNRDGNPLLSPNSLSDLSRREFRYAHQNTFDHTTSAPYPPIVGTFPYDARQWGVLGLPTLRECSYGVREDGSLLNSPWIAGAMVHGAGGYYSNIGWSQVVTQLDRNVPPDFWIAPHPWDNVDTKPSASANYDNTPGVDLDSGTWSPNVSNPSAPEAFAFMGSRGSGDAILSHVVGFDVKVWDPGAPVLAHNPSGKVGGCVILEPGDLGYPHPSDAQNFVGVLQTAMRNATDGNPSNDSLVEWGIVRLGAFVDLNYGNGLTEDALGTKTAFDGPGHPKSQLNGYHSLLQNAPVELRERIASTFVYDTWSTHYESNWNDLNENGIPDSGDTGDENNNGLFDEGSDGFDNNNDGIVDDINERETMPPYPVALRGIQIKIRVYEPDSRQMREVTVTSDFLPR